MKTHKQTNTTFSVSILHVKICARMRARALKKQKNLKSFLSKTCSEDAIDHLIAEVDTNNDRLISFDELATVF